MLALIAFSSLLVLSSAQYNYQGSPQGYQPQPQSFQPQQQSYQPQQQSYQQQQQQSYQQQPEAYQPQPQAYQPAQPTSRSHSPAAVHYVNIGKDLSGDYKFGYDTGKGNDGQSFREETRMPDGSVQGSYGYVDETGKQRIVKYTAGKNGYQVEGDGIPKGPAAAAPAPTQSAPANPEYNNRYNGNPNYRGY